jgi:hypothetical protein
VICIVQFRSKVGAFIYSSVTGNWHRGIQMSELKTDEVPLCARLLLLGVFSEQHAGARCPRGEIFNHPYTTLLLRPYSSTARHVGQLFNGVKHQLEWLHSFSTNQTKNGATLFLLPNVEQSYSILKSRMESFHSIWFLQPNAILVN